MRRGLLCAVLVLAGSTAKAAEPDATREALMDHIEASVSLPGGAAQLSAYGRYYAYLGEGRVISIYSIPFTPPDPSEGCWTYPPKEGRACTQQERDASNQRAAELVNEQLKAGERRWFDDAKDIPLTYDGGCAQVTIKYDIATNQFTYIECNGFT